ncbi:MAG TPA: Ig-like domain-containing protein [Allosphingosinicella sp.]
MAVSFTITRNTTRFHDSNGNGVKDAGETDLDAGEVGVYDPADILYTRITVTNTGDQDATGVTVEDTFSGSTLAAGSLNISPIAFNDSFTAVGNTTLRVGQAGQSALTGGPSGPSITFNGNVLTNDVGSLPGDDRPGFTVDTGAIASLQGGTVTMYADGSFTYINQAGDTGVDSFLYTIRDAGFDNITGNADDLVSIGKVTITLTGEVWYVDSAAAAGGTGTSANPFNSMAQLNGVTGDGSTGDDVDGAGDTIYVQGNAAGNGTGGGIVLEANQLLVGRGADLVVSGFTIATAGSNSTISSSTNNGYVVTVGTGNTIAGINIVGSGTNTGGITDNQAASFGTLSLNPAALNPATPGYQSTITATGAAINLSDGAIAGNGFSNTSSTGSAGTVNNLSLSNITGTLNLGTGSMTNASGASFNVSGGTVSATYSGTVGHSAATGSLLSVAGAHTGAITLNGTNSSTDGGGLVFNNADGNYTVAGTTTIDAGTSGISITNGSDGDFLFGGTMNIGQTTSVNGVSVTVSDSTADIKFNADVKQTTNFAILDVTNHSAGIFTFQTTASLDATNGSGLQFTNADGTYTMSSANTLHGGDAGIDIDTGSSGSFAFISNTVITSPTGTALNVADSTAAITFGGSITQANNAALLDVTNHSGGTINFTAPSTLTASNGTGLQFSNADATYTFNGTATIGNSVSGDAGVDIDSGSDGAFTFGSSVTLIGASGTNFSVDGGGGNITVNGTITDDNGQLVRIVNRTGGTIDFNGKISDNFDSDGGTGTAEGSIHLGGNTAGTVRFDGGINLATGANDAFTSINAAGSTATLVITDPAADVNKIATTSGTALEVVNTTIGAGGLVFESIASNGAVNGIVLNTTGSTAGLSVTGTGTAGSGGTIDNSTGVGISLTSTAHVSLDRMVIQNGDNDGINASGVNNFTLKNSTVLNNGDADEEHGVDLLNVTGALLIDNVTVRGSFEHNFKLNNTAGTLDTLNIKNSTFDHLALQSGAAGGNGVLIVTNNSAVITKASISDSTFRNNFSNGILVNVENSSRIGDNDAAANSTNGFVVSHNTFDDNNIAIQFGVFHNADLTVDIQNLNTIINDGRRGTSGSTSTSTAIVVGSSATAGAGSTLNARIDNNTIGDNNLAGSGSSIGNGIRVIVQGLTDATILINNNRVYETPSGRGIEATFLGPQDDLGTVPTSDITVTNNTVDHTNLPFNPGGGGSDAPLQAIYIAGDNQGSTSSAAGAPTVRADVRNNVVPSTSANGVGFTNNWLEVIEYPGPAAGNISVLDTGAANVSADAQLKANNTGVVGANSDVGLITGTINLPPDLSPLPMFAEVPPPPPPVEDEPPVVTPPVVDGPTPTPTPTPTPVPPPTPTPTPEAVPAGPVVVDDGVLSRAELDFITDAAIQRWAAAGATAEQIAAMREVRVSVSDMGGLLLGESGAGTIVVDSDAAGWRWFVDSTPGDDSEYRGSGSKLSAADPNGLAGTRIDLLTVLTHELGHQIGLSDLSALGSRDELMYGTIAAGERRLPGSDDLSDAAAGPVTGAFAFAPITIGTLPAGQKLIIEFRHSIDSSAEDGLVGAWTGKTIVDSDQTLPQDSNSESGNIDGLALGDRIINDFNKNGLYDAGDSTIAGVVLSLYADTNNDGDYDEGVDLYVGYNEVNNVPGYQQGIDTPAAPGTGTALKATTDASGTYSFSGLAPGDYIVRVDASNFQAGGALAGKVSTPGVKNPNDTNADGDSNVVAPADVNVDNDDNGEQFLIGQAGTYAASRAIRLDYGQETVAGPLGLALDTNNSLDLTFFAPNAAPVIGAVTGDSATYYEGGAAIPIDVGQNATVTDSDSANFDGGSLTLAVNGSNGDSVVWGPNATFDGSNNVFVGATNIGTLSTAGNQIIVTLNANANAANIQTLIRNFKFAVNGDTPVAGIRTFTFTLVDGDGKDGGLGNDTGTASSTIEVVPVSDAPVGADRAGTGLYDSTGTAYTFTLADFATGFTDPNDSPANSFAGIKIATVPSATDGTIYYDSNPADATPGVAVVAGSTFTAQDLIDGKLTFVGAAGSAGHALSFTFQVYDDGSTANSGEIIDASPNTFSATILAGNAAPVLDLDADDSNTVGTGFASSYTEGGAAARIGDVDVSIIDSDSGDDIVSATVTITNPETGDKLNVGTLPATVTVDGSSTDTVVKLVAAAGTSRADFEAAIEAITYSNTGDDPTDKGTNTTRSISVVVNDGTGNSNVATATVSVADDNADAPSGTSATIAAMEDLFRPIQASDLGFSDSDGTFASVTISAVSGGKIYVDADGSAGANPPVEATLPVTFTAQDLIDGKASFKAEPNANGNGLGTITFVVTDDDGNTDSSPNVLTVNVVAVNDSPVLVTPGPIAATEQVTVAILPAGSVSDVDLDALNNGNGDYAGAQFSVNRNSMASTDDVFTLVAGPNFTIDGIDLKTTGGQVFATISANNAGLIVINFTSAQAIATSALVDEVIQAVRYTNVSNNPPASVDLAVGFTDGSPGGGQGSGATGLDVNNLMVNIQAVNDAPVNSLGASVTVSEDSVNQALTGMSISDPDANPTDLIYVTFQVENGALKFRYDVAGGITSGDVIGEAVDGTAITIGAPLTKINATLAASNGLTYTPKPNFSGTDTLTVTTNDNGQNGSDPGLSGDGTSEEDIDTRTITVSAQPDAPIAKPDAVSTPENAIKTGSLFADNGSGADSDADAGDAITVSEVNGSPADVGQEIILASGAKLKVNADGTYSYDPNGKFTRLTDNTSGAVNTSKVGDTFSYTVAGGNTVSVTVTVTGVAGPGDWLEGNATDNTITGTPQGDFFFVVQGGDEDLSGLGGNDVFFFGPAMTSADEVDGGEGIDQIALQGDYSAGLTFGADVLSIENLAILPGNDTRFGASGGSFYDYNLTLLDVNVASGVQMVIDANRLRLDEDFTFNGSAETDGSFFIYGGGGTDKLTGGAKNDVFLFGAQGQWGSSDILTGGGGIDQLALRGDYVITFGANQLTSIEQIALVSAFDTRFGNLGDSYDYDLTMNDGNVAGIQMTIDAALLRSNEKLTFNGSAEDDGSFRVFGGAGNDLIQGSQNADIIVGRGNGDTLYGNGGNDVFRYDSISDSNKAERDGIQDFNAGDVIDLSRIDANVLVDGDQAFNFIGNAQFSGTAGELRFMNDSNGGPIWLVQGDVDGNGTADFEVLLIISPADPITASDFIL